jgi:hypothetical protein
MPQVHTPNIAINYNAPERCKKIINSLIVKEKGNIILMEERTG